MNLKFNENEIEQNLKYLKAILKTKVNEEKKKNSETKSEEALQHFLKCMTIFDEENPVEINTQTAGDISLAAIPYSNSQWVILDESAIPCVQEFARGTRRLSILFHLQHDCGYNDPLVDCLDLNGMSLAAFLSDCVITKYGDIFSYVISGYKNATNSIYFLNFPDVNSVFNNQERKEFFELLESKKESLFGREWKTFVHFGLQAKPLLFHYDPSLSYIAKPIAIHTLSGWNTDFSNEEFLSRYFFCESVELICPKHALDHIDIDSSIQSSEDINSDFQTQSSSSANDSFSVDHQLLSKSRPLVQSTLFYHETDCDGKSTGGLADYNSSNSENSHNISADVQTNPSLSFVNSSGNSNLSTVSMTESPKPFKNTNVVLETKTMSTSSTAVMNNKYSSSLSSSGVYSDNILQSIIKRKKRIKVNHDNNVEESKTSMYNSILEENNDEDSKRDMVQNIVQVQTNVESTFAADNNHIDDDKGVLTNQNSMDIDDNCMAAELRSIHFFLKSKYIFKLGSKIQVKELYDEYVKYCSINDPETTLTMTAFGIKMSELIEFYQISSKIPNWNLVEKVRHGKGYFWKNIDKK